MEAATCGGQWSLAHTCGTVAYHVASSTPQPTSGALISSFLKLAESLFAKLANLGKMGDNWGLGSDKLLVFGEKCGQRCQRSTKKHTLGGTEVTGQREDKGEIADFCLNPSQPQGCAYCKIKKESIKLPAAGTLEHWSLCRIWSMEALGGDIRERDVDAFHTKFIQNHTNPILRWEDTFWYGV